MTKQKTLWAVNAVSDWRLGANGLVIVFERLKYAEKFAAACQKHEDRLLEESYWTYHDTYTNYEVEEINLVDIEEEDLCLVHRFSANN